MINNEFMYENLHESCHFNVYNSTYYVDTFRSVEARPKTSEMK